MNYITILTSVEIYICFKEKEYIMNQYVMPYKGKWAVKGERAEEITSVHDTKKEELK